MENIKLTIPPRELMTQTNEGDPVHYHYYPITNFVYRKRLRNTFRLVRQFHFDHVLEIGYGSGIFLPTLSKLADKVTALDIHTKTAEVQKLLDHYEVKNTELVSADIMKMPFGDNSFDGIVIVSTLEDIEDSGRAVGEIKRVLKPGGQLVVSFPVKNLITDAFFHLMGEDPEEIHPSDHRYILKFLGENFTEKKLLKFPPLVPVDLSLYVSVHYVNDKK